MRPNEYARDDDPNRTEIILRPGGEVFGRYVLVEVVGEGGMGVVWRARDEKLERDVALKFLPDRVRRDPEAIRDLKRETRRCLDLTHVNIVRVYDFVEDYHAAAIAMEFVPGKSLSALKAARPGGCFDAEDLAPLVRQLCAALDYAHGQAKVVHRDLKPANLLVTEDGVLKVADFGIARSLRDTHSRQTGDVRGASGTLAFMGPQQLESKAQPAATDDIYSLGATLYDLLTGKPSFYGADIFTEIRTAVPVPLTERRAELENTGAPIPPTWERTVLVCLAKRAENRPPSAGVVLALLEGRVDPDKTVELHAPPDPDRTVVLPRREERAGGGASPGEVAQASRLPAKDNRQDAGATPSRRLVWLGLAGVAVLGALAFAFWPKPAPVGPALVAAPPIAAKPAPAVAAVADRGPVTVETKPGAATRAGPTGAAAPAMLPREFVVTVDPADAGAHLWLGPLSDLTVPADGRALVKDLPDGEHELVVQAPGYQPLTTRVTVKDGRGSAEAKLVAVKGAVEIAARAGTLVTVVDARGRETRMGMVPANGALSSDNLLTVGAYTFKLEHADCTPVEQASVELRLGRMVKIAPAQTPLPGELRIFSVPTGAEVAVNGRAAGVTPATLRRQPSEVVLAVEIFARGYRRSAQTVTLRPKEVRTLNVGTLAAESGGIALRWTKDQGPGTGAEVKIDGKVIEVGRVVPNAPIQVEGLEVGSRTVEITHADYERWKQTVAVRDQETTSVEVELAPKPGVLSVTVSGPAEYTLRVNGAVVGSALAAVPSGTLGAAAARPQGPALQYEVPAGEKLGLEISARDYKSAARTITLAANGREAWEITLEKQIASLTKEMQIEKGKQVYMNLCFACHQTDGKGLPGAFPPLARSDFMLTDRDRAVRIVLKGLSGPVVVNGQTINSVMPPQEAILTDQQIADVLTYVFNSWGNEGEAFKSDHVESIRNETR